MATHINSSHLQPQLGAPSQNHTQPTFQSCKRQNFAGLPPAIKNGQQVTSTVQQPRELHGAPVVQNNRYHDLMMPLPNSGHPQNHFNNFSGPCQQHVNSNVNALPYHTTQTTGTTRGAPTYHTVEPQHHQYIMETDEDFIDEDLVYVPDDYDVDDYGDNYY